MSPRSLRGAASAARRRVRAAALPRHDGPPDFVGVGTQKSGTTWWYGLLCDHPGVQESPKERHFFDPYWSRPFGDADVEAYRRLFPRTEGRIVGEWTPRYLHDFWTPALIRRAAPDAKILMLLRDPIERFRSGINHERQRFLTSVSRDRREYASELIVSDALSRSLYGRQVANLLQSFPRDQVLVLQYERCVESPETELRRSFEFLELADAGHRPDFILEHAGRRHRPTDLPTALFDGADAAITRDLEILAGLVPDLDLGLWGRG